MSTDVNVPAGIPWRFDFENMPKDGSMFFAWSEKTGGPIVAKCGAPWKLEGFIQGNNPYNIDPIVAWCPITTPIPPLTTQEDHS